MGQLKERKITASIACILFSLFSCNCSFAQLHAPNLPENKSLILAEEQYQLGNYELSKQFADRYLKENNCKETADNNEIARAQYFVVVSNLKLDIPGSADSAVKMFSTTANPAYKQRVAHAMAQYYFRHNKLEEGIPYYEKANIANLSNDEIADEKFELAYCYFNNKQFDKAEPLFASIKELKEGKYYQAGNYYYGLLAYNSNKYQEALKSFDRIKGDKEYKNVVPYYIAEIYYFTGDRKRALNEAETLMQRKDKLYYDNELRLLAAQCLFEEQKFADALPHFEYYYEHTDKIRKEDLYEMAFCYYMANDWSKATEKFKQLSNTHDSLGQTAMYLLGDCYLKTKDKQSARSAFAMCADLPFNRGQQEAAMILNAKLCYEMGYNDEAAKQLDSLLVTYPTSKYKDEAKTLLSALLIKTGRYTDAYNMLRGVSSQDENF